MELVKENTNSIEVTKNSKGYTWKIKVYDNDSQKAIEKILRIFLKQKNQKWRKQHTKY